MVRLAAALVAMAANTMASFMDHFKPGENPVIRGTSFHGGTEVSTEENKSTPYIVAGCIIIFIVGMRMENPT